MNIKLPFYLRPILVLKWCFRDFNCLNDFCLISVCLIGFSSHSKISLCVPYRGRGLRDNLTMHIVASLKCKSKHSHRVTKCSYMFLNYFPLIFSCPAFTYINLNNRHKSLICAYATLYSTHFSCTCWVMTVDGWLLTEFRITSANAIIQN